MFIQFLVLINKKLYIRDVFSLLYVVLMARKWHGISNGIRGRPFTVGGRQCFLGTSGRPVPPMGESVGRPLVPGETLPAPPVMNWVANRHYNFWT